MVESCANCVYMRQIEVVRPAARSISRRVAPVCAINAPNMNSGAQSEVGTAIWPEVSLDYWCGQWSGDGTLVRGNPTLPPAAVTVQPSDPASVNVNAPNVTVTPATINVAAPNVTVSVAAPNVTVNSPTISVAAPNVTVNPPTISVAAPTINVTGFGALMDAYGGDTVQTIGAQTATLRSVPVPTSRTYHLDVILFGADTTFTNGARFEMSGLVARAAGDVFEAGTLTTMMAGSLGAISGSIAANTVSQTADIVVTGVVNTTINWSGFSLVRKSA